ncbi:MAG: LysM peptidoglycan-binding domain-containing protein, partial [Paramuribaculum sp.]|nr:LysM peptidoglycan-binding domain-containing protein [Paramuribaculum sp.]
MKSFFAKICFVIGCISLSLTAMADSVAQLPVKTVRGVKYHTYTVARHETVYSLCRRFGITRMELEKYNPSVADGLKAGQELLFPVENTVVPVVDQSVAEQPKQQSQPVNTIPVQPDYSENQTVDYATGLYQVQPHESAYGISRRFDMTLDEFYRLNPATRESGVKAGEYVKV